jgi:hypothetical protein
LTQETRRDIERKSWKTALRGERYSNRGLSLGAAVSRRRQRQLVAARRADYADVTAITKISIWVPQ